MNPVGFSPCGVAFGVVRSHNCYSAPCKFFADTDRDNRIIWYFVPDNRPFYVALTQFTPRVDDMFDPSGGEYELAGRIPCPRRHYSGRDIWYHPGTHLHGDTQDFLGESLLAKYLPESGPIEEPCQDQEHVFTEIGLTFRVHDMPAEPVKAGLKFTGILSFDAAAVEHVPAGLAVAGLVSDVPIIVERRPIGLATGSILSDVAAAVEHVPAGLAVAGIVSDIPPEEIPAGFALGTIGTEPAPDVEAFPRGLALAAAVEDVEPMVGEETPQGLCLGVVVEEAPPEAIPTGLALGVGVEVVTPAVEEHGRGLALGIVGDDLAALDGVGEENKAGLELGVDVADEDAEEHKAGLALGIVVEDVSSGPTPGSDCASAGLMTLGVSVMGSVDVGQTHVYKFNVTNGTLYHVRVTWPSSGFQSMSVDAGSNCGSAVNKFAISGSSGCNTFTASADGIGVIYLHPDAFAAPTSYTVIADTGAC